MRWLKMNPAFRYVLYVQFPCATQVGVSLEIWTEIFPDKSYKSKKNDGLIIYKSNARDS